MGGHVREAIRDVESIHRLDPQDATAIEILDMVKKSRRGQWTELAEVMGNVFRAFFPGGK